MEMKTKYNKELSQKIWDGLTKSQQIECLRQAEMGECNAPSGLPIEFWKCATHYMKYEGLARVAHIEGGECEAIRLLDIGKAYLMQATAKAQKKKRNTVETSEIRGCLLVQADKKDELLKKLHLLIDGKKGKAVALVIRLCVELGLMSRPTFTVLKVEFPGIGNKSGYNTHYREFETRYPKEEIDGMKANLITFQEYI